MRRSSLARIAILLASLLLAGCVSLRDPETSYDYTGEIVATLEPGAPAGQTFVSRRPGLNGVQLWLRTGSEPRPGSPEAKDTDVLSVALYHSLEDSQPLVTTTVPYAQIARAFPVNITFSAQKDPPNQAYYLQLETKGGPLLVYGRNEDGYPDGELISGGKTQEADLAFRASYDYAAPAMLSDLGEAIRGGWLLLPLLLLLWAPGRLALEAADAALGKGGDFLSSWDWGERTALAVGLSLGITPLALLWTTTLGLHWGRGGALAVAGLTGLGLAWVSFRRVRGGGRLPRPSGYDLALALVFLFALGIRLAMARDLAAPAWVDSVHHVTIIRMILEKGAYPQSYVPYAQVSSTVYHPGFHGLAAAFDWLSGLEPDKGLLILGQALNALIVPAIYLLARSLTGSRLAGLLAGLVAGTLTLMPAYYTSWGRYTQLAGLLILPVCAALLMRLLEEQAFPAGRQHETHQTPGVLENLKASFATQKLRPGARLACLAALASAGLFMVHYRVVAFMALLMIAYFIGELLRSMDKQPLWRSVPMALAWVSATALLAVLISLPWWPGLIRATLLPRLAVNSAAPQPLAIDWGYLTPIYGTAMLWLAAAGLLISIGRAAWFGPVLALWVGLLFVSANQGSVHVPGAGLINLSSVEIMLFMPIAILAGYAVSEATGLAKWAAERLAPRWGRYVVYSVLGIGMLAGAAAGAQKMLPILNPNTLLFREADRPAMRWISQNLPSDATILINPFLWGYGYYAGADGGYWISPMTGRYSMPPNLLYASGPREAALHVNQIAQKTLDLAGDPAGLEAMMKEEGIHYIYVGRKGGALSPRKLEESGLFQARYHQGGVWIFEAK